MIQIRMFVYSIIIVCFSFLCPLTFAATINVPVDQPTIQAGIDAAQNGDTVLVDDGTYKGEGNVNIDFKGKEITLKSRKGAESTVIDCEEKLETRGFYFHNGETNESVLDGFTVINGSHQVGGAITLISASPTIKNCVVKDNLRPGIYCLNSALNVTDTIVSRNIGSGILMGGIDFLLTLIRDDVIQDDVSLVETFIVPTIKNCTISDNTGNGIYCVLESAIIDNCTVSNNGGRGINLDSFAGADITNCHITVNSGGGLICQDYSGITIKNSIIDKNTAENGGGIFCSPTSRLNATDCVIANNTALKNGGGIWDLTRFGNAYVKYCTITQNSAGNRGGGICVEDRGHLNMTNSIVWNNTSDRTHAEVFAQGSVTINSCNIKNGLMGVDPDGRQKFLKYVDNIDEDPLFVNADAGDFTLQPNSPAEGMGKRDEADQEEDVQEEAEQEVVEQEQNEQEQEKEDPLSVSHHGKRLVKWADLKRR